MQTHQQNFINVTKNQKIAIVELQRIGKLNALSIEFIGQIKQVLQELEEANDVDGIIITGTENCFIAGADINVLKTLDSFTGREFLTLLQSLCGAIRHHKKPIIAGVNGHCYGAGLEVAISCDMMIASENATFGMQEVKIGMPSVIEAALFPFIIGLQKTREFLLTGEVIDAQAALEMNMIHYKVSRDELMSKCIETALRITSNPGYAVTLQKQLINRWLENAGLEISIKNGVDFVGIAFGKEESREILGQVLNKGGKQH